MDDKWDVLLNQFRSLGGVADNICQMEGKNGRGLFPLEPTKKSRIFVPKELLIKRKDVYLDKDGSMRLKPCTGYSCELVSFFHFYQDNFSWGGGGKEIEESFENGLKSFPLDVKDYLKRLGIVDIVQRHNTSWKNFIFETYLNRRGFDLRGESIIVPLLELVNYLPDCLPLIVSQKGIKHPEIDISGNEITHQYNFASPLARWIQLGFTCKEPMAFSLPFNSKLIGTNLILNCQGQSLDEDEISFKKESNTITIKGFPIANIDYKELPFEYLYRLSSLLKVDFDISLFLKELVNYNINARKDFLNRFTISNNYSFDCLESALKIEIELIEQSNNK